MASTSTATSSPLRLRERIGSTKDDSLLKAQVAVQVMITFNGGVYRDTGFAPLTDVRVTSVEKIT